VANGCSLLQKPPHKVAEAEKPSNSTIEIGDKKQKS